MCLAAVYEVRDGNENLVCEYAAEIAINGDIITLTDIMGDELVLTGALKHIDLVKNTISILIPA